MNVSVWKPSFEGGSVPVKNVVAKATEYAGNMTGRNIFGYLTYNGFTETGVEERKERDRSKSGV